MTESPERRVGAVIVLAAGGGTRMRSRRAKVLHEIGGRSLIAHALAAAEGLEPRRTIVVIGHQREQVAAHLAEVAPEVTTAVQAEQRGTGHAVLCGLEAVGDAAGEIVVTYGDVPLLAADTLAALVAAHRAEGAAVTVLTARVPDPTGYGRVVRGEEGDVQRIVEHRDASEAERAITEINSGIYVFQPGALRDGLARIGSDNDQGEIYLTDMIAISRAAGGRVAAHVIDDVWQTEGVNDRVQLSRLGAELNRRTVERWMRAGVTVIDPATTWVQVEVDLAQDVTLKPNTSLEGATSVGEGATIGPDTVLKDVEVGAGATVTRTQGSLAVIGENAEVGPFAYLRPGTELGAKGKIGTFVETKNAKIGAGAKVPHLCYCGDAIVDEAANIGAGTIFANYDGENKSHTHVGRSGFVGSNSVLVAPVDIGDGAYVAAGSTVTEDVAAGDLAVARGRQHNAAGWVAKRKRGSKFDLAAQASSHEVDPAVVADRQRLAEQAGKDNS